MLFCGFTSYPPDGSHSHNIQYCHITRQRQHRARVVAARQLLMELRHKMTLELASMHSAALARPAVPLRLHRQFVTGGLCSMTHRYNNNLFMMWKFGNRRCTDLYNSVVRPVWCGCTALAHGASLRILSASTSDEKQQQGQHNHRRDLTAGCRKASAQYSQRR